MMRDVGVCTKEEGQTNAVSLSEGVGLIWSKRCITVILQPRKSVPMIGLDSGSQTEIPTAEFVREKV